MQRVLRTLPVALLALGAHGVGAQQFIGTVVAPDGRTPVAGVLVVASDSTGRAIARSVSTSDGRFTLFVDSAITVTVRLLRTGFAPTDAATRRLGADELVDLVAVLGDSAIVVPRFRRGATTCGRGGAADRAMMELALEEARKALHAAQGTIGRADLEARFATFDHRVAKTAEDTLRSLLRRSTGALPSLFRATTTEELEQDGFFVTVGGERVFRAPEPALLASPWFFTTHCFTAVPQGDTALRLDFRPTRERRGRVDVQGAFVLEPRTLALRRVELEYVGLREEERFSKPLGSLEFAQLLSGDWVTTRWWQRFPLLGYRSGDGTTTFVRTTMTLVDVIGHRIQGGQVLAVEADRRVLFRADPVDARGGAAEFAQACPERVVRQATGAVRGRLVAVDSESVSGVLVRATWGDPVVVDRTQLTTREFVREAITDAQGSWTICDIPMRREGTVRWAQRGQERTIPFSLTTPAAVMTLEVPRAP